MGTGWMVPSDTISCIYQCRMQPNTCTTILLNIQNLALAFSFKTFLQEITDL